MLNHGVRLLALDGGGVRGLSSLIILQHLMQAVNPHAPPKPCDYFDMIGGTSTGGLIAIILGRLQMSIDDCIDAYLKLSGRIFQKKQHRLTIKGKIQGRFDSDELERAVKEIITKQGMPGDTLLKDEPDAACKVFVCATRKHTRGIQCLTSYPSPRGNNDLLHSVKIWEACRATAAASSFFDPIKIGRYNEEFVDGATGANNPVMELWNQAQLMWEPELAGGRVQCLVSVGSGVPSLKGFQDDAFVIWGTLKDMVTDTEQTAERFRRDKAYLDNSNRYFRFNVSRGLEGVGLEESTKINEIASATREYVESQELFKQLQTCAGNLAGRGNGEYQSNKWQSNANHTGFHFIMPSDEEIQCLRALRLVEYEKIKDRNPDRLKGTCEWFFRHERFHEWLQRNSGLLFVSADPGCGKSVLAKSLVDREIKSTESRTTCYFFFKDDNTEQKSVTVAFSSLLHQLFSQKQSLIQHAMQDYTTDGDQLPKNFHKLWNILVKATSDPKAGEVFCILDALDECVEAERYQIIDILSTFYKQSQNSTQLKFLVTSRPYIDIERKFASLVRHFPTIRIHGERESKAISHEIDLVIRSKVSELGQELEIDDSEQSALQDELLTMENRTYLWLKLLIDVIRSEVDPTKQRLKRIINTLPATVDQAYESILLKAQDQGRAQKLLHIIVAARRPLTLKEMNIALAIEDHYRSYEDLDFISKNEARFATIIRNLCGLFINIIDQKVYLIHQTVKEFLVGKDQALLGCWKHSLNPVESESLMARICITYLMFREFEDNFKKAPIHDRTAMKHYIKQYGYLEYAASFWGTHYKEAQGTKSEVILQSVLTLCNSRSRRFQIWFNIYWNMAHSNEPTPQLHSIAVASYFGHECIVKQLLETGADVESKDSRHGQTPLSWASMKGHEAIVNGRQFKSKDSEFCQTPLLWATKNGHEAIVSQLLEAGANNESKDKLHQTPLLWAAQRGYEPIVKHLLEAGADVEPTDRIYRRTPLSWVAMNGHEAVAKQLLEAGANIETKDEFHRTPLLLAAQRGYAPIVRHLLEAGADVELEDRIYRRTPLSWAAKNGHGAVAKQLLETGADVESKDSRHGQTPLSWAATNGHEAIVKQPLEAGANVESGNNTPLLWATKYGHEAIVVQLLEAGPNVELGSPEDNETSLLCAAMYGHEAIIKQLLKAGANIESKDSFGNTPLLQATKNGHKIVIEQLLKAGANIESKDNYGHTPLLWATEKGKETLIEQLLKAGANIESKDNYGQTPLSWATENGHKIIIEQLLKAGANIESKDNHGQTPLAQATKKRHFTIIKQLLKAGANTESKDDYGQTPLSWATKKGYKAIVKLLLEAGAKVDS